MARIQQWRLKEQEALRMTQVEMGSCLMVSLIKRRIYVLLSPVAWLILFRTYRNASLEGTPRAVLMFPKHCISCQQTMRIPVSSPQLACLPCWVASLPSSLQGSAAQQALALVYWVPLRVCGDLAHMGSSRSQEPWGPLLLGHLSHSPYLPGMMMGTPLLTLVSLVMNFLFSSPSGSRISFRMSCSL